jgi:hypothetical protein
MEIPFVLNGVAGRLLVDYRRNTDPASVGCTPETAGYPICTAIVERPFRGYDSLMGWASTRHSSTLRAARPGST